MHHGDRMLWGLCVRGRAANVANELRRARRALQVRQRSTIYSGADAGGDGADVGGGATAAASDGQQAKRIAELEAQLAADRVTGNTCISLRAYVQAGAARGREGEKRGPRGGGGN